MLFFARVPYWSLFVALSANAILAIFFAPRALRRLPLLVVRHAVVTHAASFASVKHHTS